MVGYDTNARKRPINLSVNRDLVEKARALGINASALLEERLADEVVRRQREAFVREAEFLAGALNEVHAQYGSPIDEYWIAEPSALAVLRTSLHGTNAGSIFYKDRRNENDSIYIGYGLAWCMFFKYSKHV